ncbi:AMP-binding protein [Stappia indica]|uniref:AMP-binding protein n=1 Tax=Stappia indica TaxID=538381 RepID=UPI001CD409F8|nr:AMP-binding protein [Stappia indica]MCA1296879.1 AMP-binding protein [Stappia indica]
MDEEQVTPSFEGRFMDCRSVAGLLKQQAVAFADHDMLVLPQSVQALWPAEPACLRYAEMQAAVGSLSEQYVAAGYGAGDRIALLLENRPAHFLHWLALNAIAASVVPVNPQASADELSYLLSHSEARLLVRLPDYAARTDTVAAELNLACCAPDDSIPPRAMANQPGVPALHSECALIYTSGTTGRPKGCILSNRYFLNWADWYSSQDGLIALRPGQERLLTPLPTFHVNAMGHSFMGMLSCGGAQIIVDRFHPRSWWQDAVQTEATCFHYLGVMPAILHELPETEFEHSHQMRFGLGGGVHPDHHARFEKRFGVPLLEGWAMTETGGAGTLCDTTEPRHVGQRCIGRPDRPGPPLEVRLVGDDGVEVAEREAGELLLRAPGPDPRLGFFSGYLKDEAATEAAWSGGWLHTGDVVRQDESGALFFVERKKNIIRRSGENIAAAEVEAAIASLPEVSAIAVVATDDPLREQEVLAVVVPTDSQQAAEQLADRIFAYCAVHLAYFKVPGYIAFVSALPTTSTQKVQKASLKPLADDPFSADACFDLRDRKKALRQAPA